MISGRNKKLESRTWLRHRTQGQGLAEIAPALTILILILIVVADFAILPLRYVIADELIKHSVKRLAQSETFSEAKSEFEGEGKLYDSLVNIGGIKPVNLELSMVASSLTKDNASTSMTGAGGFPRQWLPNGSSCPCNYSLQLVANVEISPAIVMSLPCKIEGLSAPVACVLSASERWENRTRNPVTKNYFLNE